MKLEQMLQSDPENHILPFLWVHGEDEATYRKMVNVIHEANIGAFCVEARPHPQFCEEQWWRDMTVILDEAEKRGMKVWILDDKHFPTGFANGAVKDAPLALHRRQITHRSIPVKAGGCATLSMEKLCKPNDHLGLMDMMMLMYAGGGKMPKKVGVNELLSCTAWSGDKAVDLTDDVRGGKLRWQAPNEGEWSIEICGLTYDSGAHRDYINMMDAESCRLLIDAVYEPHYAHFADKFGTVIAGFFSDEPELGNGSYVRHYNMLGTAQTLPYSDTLAEKLAGTLGAGWKAKLPLLWLNGKDPDETARVRYSYMDCVTRLVQECFSEQIGGWCREHGVAYIGHVIEDNNQHARTATSLGHYFRGLSGQDMAGIDDIGDQIMPNGEDRQHKTLFGYNNDGEFYQYALGKLGVSLSALYPRMQGRTMCECFGNYGWSEGVQLMRYILDHLLVRGVNYFVPHAFTCSRYPEKDCPPHFYAEGHNPQYRHFGRLMLYGNRVSNLISGGKPCAQVAILYHGEAEWAGKAMLMQKPARVLADRQVDFLFVPSDAFSEPLTYRTQIAENLTVNGIEFKLLVIPYAEYLTRETANGIEQLLQNGGDVVFIDALPSGIATGEPLPESIGEARVLKLDELAGYTCGRQLSTVILAPENDRIRALHYIGRRELFMLFNESDTRYDGAVTLPAGGHVFGYDAWNDCAFALAQTVTDGRTQIPVSLDSHKSLLVLTGETDAVLPERPEPKGKKIPLKNFTQSVCPAPDYPDFIKQRPVTALEGYEKTDPRFSGFIRYECSIEVPQGSRAVLEITDAFEGVEVFVDGVSAGIQVSPVFLFDLTERCKPGENALCIEVATTLARERGKRVGSMGITGEVNLYLS